MAEGYGAKYEKYNAENTPTVQKLKQNIYHFSAAKTYQQLAHYNSLLVDENGKERTFNDFKKEVLKVHPTYNQNYLQAEYQTARASGQMAAKWEGFQRNKERYPYLKYKTVGDDHVRDDHRALDGFIAHIDDPIWDRIYPPNDWRCRCFVVQTNAEPKDNKRPDLKFMKPEFSVNVGKTGKVWNEKHHPYFVIPKTDLNSYKIAFENFKLITTYGKAKHSSKGKVYVSPFADASDLFSNYRNAVLIADNLKVNIKIRPHVDTNILKGLKNYEYEINKLPADLKSIKGYRGILSGLNAAKRQGVSVVVFNLNQIEKLNITEVYRRLKGNITANRKTSIKKVILIYKNKVVQIDRKSILDNTFKETLEKLKS